MIGCMKIAMVQNFNIRSDFMRMKDFYIFKALCDMGSYSLSFSDLRKFRRVLKDVESSQIKSSSRHS
jgi:hypothetical protein